MKKITLVTFALLFVGFGLTAKASTEEVRYWDYYVGCLEQIQRDGGFMNGEFYDSHPGADKIGYQRTGFTAAFRGGSAQTTVRLDPGWFQAWTGWEDPVFRDQLFQSTYVEQTYFGAGLQAMPFLMTLNGHRSVRFQFVGGALPSDTDQVWFGGIQAWRDGKVWRAGINRPWNTIGTEVEVVWVGNGGWRVQMIQSSFEGVITLEAVSMDASLISPTKVKAITLLAESYLEDEDLVKYGRQFYSQDLGCNVLEMKVGNPDLNISEFTIVLRGYDQGSGCWVNYYTAYLENVSGVFLIPLGNTQILPMTEARIYLIDPRTGEYVWRWLDTPGLWYELMSPSTGGGKGG
jgi:hypothetical protein